MKNRENIAKNIFLNSVSKDAFCAEMEAPLVLKSRRGNCRRVVGIFGVWPNLLLRRKRDWIFHHVVAKPQVVKNKIPHESRVALPRVTNGEFYPIPFSPWWRTDIPILHTKFWISILHMWGIDIAWFNFSTVETISIPHTWGIDRAWLF